MKKIYPLLILFSIFPLVAFAQYDEIAPGFKKEKHRKIISTEMDKLLNRVYLETDCPKDQLKYYIIDTHTAGYKPKDLQLPKTIIIKACGINMTYINPNKELINEWKLDGVTWVLNSAINTKTKEDYKRN